MKTSKLEMYYPKNRIINPDGLDIEIPWEDCEVGSSMFIPCINFNRAGSQLHRITKQVGVKVNKKRTIENGKIGLRLWIIKWYSEDELVTPSSNSL